MCRYDVTPVDIKKETKKLGAEWFKRQQISLFNAQWQDDKRKVEELGKLQVENAKMMNIDTEPEKPAPKKRKTIAKKKAAT